MGGRFPGIFNFLSAARFDTGAKIRETLDRNS